MALFDVLIKFAPVSEPQDGRSSETFARVSSALAAMVGLGKAVISISKDIGPSSLFEVEVLESDSGIKLDHGARERLGDAISEVVRKAMFPSLRSTAIDGSLSAGPRPAPPCPQRRDA